MDKMDIGAEQAETVEKDRNLNKYGGNDNICFLIYLALAEIIYIQGTDHQYTADLMRIFSGLNTYGYYDKIVKQLKAWRKTAVFKEKPNCRIVLEDYIWYEEYVFIFPYFRAKEILELVDEKEKRDQYLAEQAKKLQEAEKKNRFFMVKEQNNGEAK